MCKRISTRDQVLMYINQYTADHGIAPSLREIAAGVGLSSPGSVHHHVTSLKEEGLLKDYAPRKSRALVVSKSVKPGTEEKHICLKTNNGKTIILSMAANRDKIQFEGLYYVLGEHSSMGQIVACSEMNEEEYYASII